MAKVRIITDVTAHLEPELIAKYEITVLPMEITFGGVKYVIGPGDSSQTLFERMAEGPARPAQATIPAGAFQEGFERLNKETEDILVLLSSSKLSDAHAQAQKATRAFLGRCEIMIVDSLTTSWGLGLIVKAAAKAAEEGQTLDEIVRLIRGILPHIYVVFFVDRLDYLEGGGRIGVAQALLGTMLRIKPLLLIEEGDIIPLEKVRTMIMAIEKLSNFVAEFASLRKVVILRSPLDEGNGQLVAELEDQLSLSLPDQEFEIVDYDPVLACHLGPQALGVTVYEKI